jgi:hypothetical protein
LFRLSRIIHLENFYQKIVWPIITVQAKKYYEKAILIYKESLEKLIQLKG